MATLAVVFHLRDRASGVISKSLTILENITVSLLFSISGVRWVRNSKQMGNVVELIGLAGRCCPHHMTRKAFAEQVTSKCRPKG